MSRVNYNIINEIPLDIYRKILFLLDPNDLSEECSTNQYANKVCDDNFIRDYIRKNYDPIQYKVGKWDDNIFNNPIISRRGSVKTWKEVLKRLHSKKVFDVTVDIVDRYDPEERTYPIKIPNFPIYFSDTSLDIVNRYYSILKELGRYNSDQKIFLEMKPISGTQYYISSLVSTKINITSRFDNIIYSFDDSDIIGTVVIPNFQEKVPGYRFPTAKNINLFDNLIGLFGSDAS